MEALRKAGYYTAFVLPGLVVLGYSLGGWWHMITPFYVLVFLPLSDQLVGIDKRNVEEGRMAGVAKESYYKFVLYHWTWLQLTFMGWGFYVVTSGHLQLPQEWIGFTLSFALVTGGVGITVAHELGHKKEAIERFYCKLLLLTVSYMHFYIEHNKGHHVHVATPLDPASARRNESFYAFWPRSVFGSYAHAWQIENERLRRQQLSPFSWHNQMIWFTLLPFILCALAFTLFSLLLQQWAWELPLFFFAQSILAFSLLELVNYVEHYGMQRRELAPGRYERVNPLHSWNASHLFSNFLLFQLQRHSDHHTHAIRPYQVLMHHDESPQLPAGYPAMILTALVPPLWFALMNKRLDRWQAATHLAG